MNYLTHLPVWKKLTEEQQEILHNAAFEKTFRKGEILHSSSVDCTGLILVLQGQLRSYTISDDGREIALYHLFERDMCLFSASCMLNSIQFDIALSAEKDTKVLVIPSDVYRGIMDISAPLANYTNELMATRFSDVMWLVDQIMWKSFDRRLATFLINEANIEGANKLKITHEIISNHLGSPREVVTRMLKYFVSEGLIAYPVAQLKFWICKVLNKLLMGKIKDCTLIGTAFSFNCPFHRGVIFQLTLYPFLPPRSSGIRLQSCRFQTRCLQVFGRKYNCVTRFDR